MSDLPSEDPEEAGLPNEFNLWQAELGSAPFQPPNDSILSDRVRSIAPQNMLRRLDERGWRDWPTARDSVSAARPHFGLYCDQGDRQRFSAKGLTTNQSITQKSITQK